MTDAQNSAVEAVALSNLIRTRLLGVSPDDQDLVLEDHDWRLILQALASLRAASQPLSDAQQLLAASEGEG